MTIRQTPDAYYMNGTTLKPLPSWCHSYINLGHQISCLPQNEARSVVALALPTRAYASAFIATGIVTSCATNKPSVNTDDPHYKLISSLPIGTAVVYRSTNRIYKGRVNGFSENSKQGLSIEITTGTKDRKILPLCNFAPQIDVAEIETNLHEYQNGRRLPTSDELLEFWIGSDYAKKFVTETRFECLIIGKISNLRMELVETNIASKRGENRTIVGSLQEILRVKQFMPVTHAYRTQLISTLDADINEIAVPIVIFDGANAYLQNMHKCRNAHQIVVLDYTERNFQDAVDLLNQNFFNRAEREMIELDNDLPLGTEVMIFQESFN